MEWRELQAELAEARAQGIAIAGKWREVQAELNEARAEIARLQKALLTCAAIPHMGQYTGSRVRAAIEASKPWSTPPTQEK